VSRLFWIALGATAGVLLVRKASRAAEALTPQGISESLAASITTLGEAIRDFTLDVRAGMAEREHELTELLGFDDTAGEAAPGPRRRV
jgi:Family of unknown function (DUF6167)